MSSERVLLRRGLYADSVTLLQVSRQVGQAAGVQAALVGMATELNLEMLAGMGFQPPDSQSPNELFIAVRAEDRRAAAAAADWPSSCSPPRTGAPAAPPPNSRRAPSARPPPRPVRAWR